MNFRDLINPWGALRQERARIVAFEDHIAFQQRQLREEIASRRECVDTVIKHAGTIAEQQKQIGGLLRTIDSGHFRNPETGRLGPRGVVYDTKAK